MKTKRTTNGTNRTKADQLFLMRIDWAGAKIEELREGIKSFTAAVRELEKDVSRRAAKAQRATVSAALRLCGILVLGALACGCDSTDGDFHTPITGMSIEKAYRIAGEAGYIRQETKLGGRWMHVVQLEQLGLGPKAIMDLNGAPLLDAQLKQAAVFESLGRTDQQMLRAYNAAGIAWAKVGDGAIATAVMSGIVAGVMALNDDGGSGGSSKESDKGGQQATGTTINQINNSPGASINNDGGEGGQTGGGSGGSGAAQ